MIPLLPGALLALQAVGGWQEAPRLPRPVTDNTVAAVGTPDGAAVVSFLGLASADPGADPMDRGFSWEVGSEAWRELAPVPGPPRRAASAEAVGGRVYLLGGYTVDDDGSTTSVDRVDVYDPVRDDWSRAAPVPVAVDGAVSGVWRDSLVYLVGGRHDGAPVSLVQLYDPASDRWTRATPAPGAPVSGHAGAVARDAIVYLGGTTAQDDGAMEGSSWRGDIDPGDPGRIAWRRLPPHPGPPRYRATATAVGTRVVFVGGSDRPSGSGRAGSGGAAPEPVPGALVYDLVTGAWNRAPGPPEPTLGHGDLVRAGGWLVLPGGTTAGRTASDRVWRIPVLDMVAGRR